MKKKFLLLTICILSILPLSLSAKDILFKYHIQKIVIEGSKSYINVIIRNDMNDSIFMLSNLDFYISDKLTTSYGWKAVEYGSIYYDKGKDVFVHNQIAQSATSDEFYHKILFPGAEERINLFFTSPIAGQKVCVLNLFYKKYSFNGLSKSIYVNKANKGHKIIYGHPKVEEIKKWQSDSASDNFMLNFLLRDKLKLDKKSYNFKMKVSPRNFSLEKAFKIVGFKSKNYYYNKGKSSWIIGKDKDTYIVSKKKINVLQKIPFDVYKFIESSRGKVYINVWSEIDKDLKENLQKKYGRIDEHKCYHLYVPKNEVVGVLKEFIKRKYEIGMGEFQFKPVISIKKVN